MASSGGKQPGRAGGRGEVRAAAALPNPSTPPTHGLPTASPTQLAPTNQVVERYEKIETLHKEMKQKETIEQLYADGAADGAAAGGGGAAADGANGAAAAGGADEAKIDETEEAAFQEVKKRVRTTAGGSTGSVRNLRIREDTAKYLLNLDVNSAYYDPKTRSMREDPQPNKAPHEKTFFGDNFVRTSGDYQAWQALNLHSMQAFDKGQVRARPRGGRAAAKRRAARQRHGAAGVGVRRGPAVGESAPVASCWLPRRNWLGPVADAPIPTPLHCLPHSLPEHPTTTTTTPTTPRRTCTRRRCRRTPRCCTTASSPRRTASSRRAPQTSWPSTAAQVRAPLRHGGVRGRT